MNSHRSIGVFDSGVGGLTVMKQLSQLIPKETLIYFGDTARVPYGNKSADTIVRYAIENAIFLMGHNIKMLVIACNTVSSCAVGKLQQIFNIPVVETIFPAVEKSVATTRNGRIAILGTKATIGSGIYQKAIKERLPQAYVMAIASPLLVPLVEENFISHPSTKLIIQEYLAPLKRENIDTLILGCTHYPLLRSLIVEEIGSAMTIVDSALECAEATKNLLYKLQLQSSEASSAAHKYFVSDDPTKFSLMGETFLGQRLDNVELIN